MSVALLIHRPPTPPRPADKSLSNRLHTRRSSPPTSKQESPVSVPHKEHRTTANSAAATITTRSEIKQKLKLKYLSSTLLNLRNQPLSNKTVVRRAEPLHLNHLVPWL